jgi:hypothetical protein
MEAVGSLALPASRKAAKHKQHPSAAYTGTVEDIDINRSKHHHVFDVSEYAYGLGLQGSPEGACKFSISLVYISNVANATAHSSYISSTSLTYMIG